MKAATSRLAAFLSFAAFLDLLGYGIVVPALPLAVRAAGGAELVGVVLAIYPVMQLVASPLLGRWADRAGRRPVVLFSIAGNALGMALYALGVAFASLPLLVAGRIVAGACAGNLATLQIVIADVTTIEERPTWLGRFGAAMGVGVVLGPVAGGWLAALAPPLAGVAAAVVAVVALAFAWAVLPETRPERADGRDAEALPRRPLPGPILRLFALLFAASFATAGLQAVLPLHAASRFGWDASRTGLLFGAFGGTLLVVQGALLGPITRRFGLERAAFAGPLLVTVALLAVALVAGRAVLTVAVVVFAAGVALANPLATTLTTELARPEERGRVLGLQQVWAGAGRVSGPLVVGLLFAGVSAEAAFLAGAAVAGLASFAVWPLSRGPRGL